MLNSQSISQTSNPPFIQISPEKIEALKRLRDAKEERLKRLAEAREKYSSLSAFVRGSWPVLVPNPNVPLKWGWACDAICEHLEAVTKGWIKKLVINIAPRHGKSSIVSICWPAWVWLEQPSLRWLFSSYDLKLSTDLSLDCRRIIESPWYQQECLPEFVLTTDQNVKSHFDNDKQGSRIATAMQATAAGMGGDIVVVDDAHNRTDANNPAAIKASVEGWRLGISVCLNDTIDGRMVAIGQRVAQGDITDYLKGEGGWEFLILPTEFDNVKRSTSLGYYDKRTKDKELLFSERFNEQSNQEAKNKLQDDYSAQHGQNPTPTTGILYNLNDFKHIDQDEIDLLLPDLRTHRHWDLAATAAKPGTNPAFTAGVKLGMHREDKRIIILDVARGQLDPGGVETLLRKTAKADGVKTSISTEEEKGGAGKNLSHQYATKIFQGFIYTGQPIKGDKLTRAKAFAAQVKAGNVYVNKKAAFWFPYAEEMKAWPRSQHLDQGDGSSGAYNQLAFTEDDTLDLPDNTHEVNDLYAR